MLYFFGAWKHHWYPAHIKYRELLTSTPSTVWGLFSSPPSCSTVEGSWKHQHTFLFYISKACLRPHQSGLIHEHQSLITLAGLRWRKSANFSTSHSFKHENMDFDSVFWHLNASFPLSALKGFPCNFLFFSISSTTPKMLMAFVPGWLNPSWWREQWQRRTSFPGVRTHTAHYAAL